MWKDNDRYYLNQEIKGFELSLDSYRESKSNHVFSWPLLELGIQTAVWCLTSNNGLFKSNFMSVIV
jgi:hypothetical protein